MAARSVKIRHDEETRAKIKTSQLINRLSDHVLGKVEMKPTQVTAALGLLRKTIPDLSAAENKTEVVHRYVARLPEKVGTTDEWQKQHAPQTIQ
ncbi:hypothetical protein [Bradyrhizobium elkanii]|uniref:hypothetical protein n=1 Tax=Bradyrhizobium elkanii TaxID=29448 RepID=UPI001449D07D|nr:hypothetical protein [Bradyrhizobium elkanii]MCP1932525.1 hypothetical protein [Bradyrhizobium elkanii]MCS3479548.1 hypothetical protein [Bradyrhizobium elkanii]MCS3576933.1 hypothetical protein [Bradyrhizobium elkanii]MCS3719810.1 hypothetical protein [Bradyrhizobium elkanii]MCS4004227.1 hypothetical protein [Bradyrhizobium elkanii USDA 61]